MPVSVYKKRRGPCADSVPFLYIPVCYYSRAFHPHKCNMRRGLPHSAIFRYMPCLLLPE